MTYWMLIIGILMMAVTVGIHAFGSAYWLGYMASWNNRWKHVDGTKSLYRAVVLTAVFLLLLHFLEMIIGALFYISLPEKAGLTGFPEAIYFSMVTFTSLGYGDITLHQGWRALSSLEAMVGITVFGLTTALLFAVIQRLWEKTKDVTSGDEREI